jgi:putative nucleotidyltransferase with HDIG domain
MGTNSSGDDLFLGKIEHRARGDHDMHRDASFASIQQSLLNAIRNFNAENRQTVDHLTAALMGLQGDECIEERITLLIKACFYYQRIGCSFDGIPRGIAARDLACRHGLTNLERRACNSLGAVYYDSANFEEACKCFERTLTLARELGDPFFECVSFMMTGSLLKEMGCYGDALEVIDRSLAYQIDTPEGEHVRFSSAVNGIFCSHRLGDEMAALRYMTVAAESADNPLIDDSSRASFEYNRTIYLLAHDDAETAEMLIDAAKIRLAHARNPRVEIQISIASSLCDWASHDPQRETRAKKDLRDLYQRSKQTHLYHDDVLRALMQVHGRPTTREEAEVGMAYAKELVEYTTNVKHAKFYRQMSDQGVVVVTDPQRVRPVNLGRQESFDPFANARLWLTDDVSESPSVAEDPKWLAGPRMIRKHDELTAIHDDLARLRTASWKTSIRTVAYDMAENWALAAEFFDDQTGQHCFRVGRLAGMLAAEIGMDEEYCARIEHAARLHDIGKISVNELILLKPGPLDPGELTAMRAHAEVGGFLLQHSDDPTLRMAEVIARHHHEWWNGAGYPHNLTGQRIPLEARICALADVYDALTNVRPYKRAWPHRITVEQMMCESSTHFDPRLIRPFLKVLERHVGSTAVPPSTQLHLKDMEANGLLASRRKLMAAVKGQ